MTGMTSDKDRSDPFVSFSGALGTLPPLVSPQERQMAVEPVTAKNNHVAIVTSPEPEIDENRLASF